MATTPDRNHAPTLLPPATGTAVTVGFQLRHEDFVVEERPLYAPEEEGDHLFLHIEKRGRTTTEAVAILASAFQVAPKDCGYAGMKDRRGVTRQYVSVPFRSDRDLPPRGAIEDVEVLAMSRHPKRLKLGHLAGNRFAIVLRDVAPDGAELLTQRFQALAQSGLPNAFGPQRFGSRGLNHLQGQALLTGDFDGLTHWVGEVVSGSESPKVEAARKAFRDGKFDESLRLFPRGMRFERGMAEGLLRGRTPTQILGRLPRKEVDLLLSAWQSEGFNRVLVGRLGSEEILQGDVMMLARSRSVFCVEDVAEETRRLAEGEIRRTGPLLGSKVLEPTGPGLERERDLLGDYLLPESPARAMRGERRPLRVEVSEASADYDAVEAALTLQFVLPRGAFATSLLAGIGACPRERDAEAAQDG